MPKEKEKKPTTVQLDINFTENEMGAAVASKKQNRFLTQLYIASHLRPGPGPESTLSIRGRVENLKEHLGLTKETFAQIIISDDPRQNIDEEEIRLLDRYTGALTGFSWAYLTQSNLPDDLNDQFIRVESMNELELEGVLRNVWKWFEVHPRQNTPIPLDSTTTEWVGRTYQRMRGLVDFYNSNRTIPHLHAVKKEPGEALIIDTTIHPELGPLGIVVDFYSLFRPTNRHFKQFAKQIGWPVRADHK